MTIKFDAAEIKANSTNVLDTIVKDKHLEVAHREATMPLYAIEPGLEPSSRDFYASLQNDFKNKGAGFILEIKKASPSKGLIRPNFDLDEICDAYQHYASCVSVLTDEKYFQGDFERLPLVREKLNQPLLCKDFFVSPYQVYLARFYGADAILLMLSVLDDTSYQQLASVAKQLDMDILTEVSNEQEMTRAVALGANIIGINNRNLRDLTTDLNQTPHLVALFDKLATPEQNANTLLISESGIYSHLQVKQLSTRAHGFLVGSSLMAEPDLRQACRRLVVGEIKVCGITNSEDFIAIENRDIDYAGLITVPESPRFVSNSDIQSLVNEAKRVLQTDTFKTKLVMVTRDLDIDDVVHKLTLSGSAVVQLHGKEDPSYVDSLCDALAKANLNVEIWKAIGIDTSQTDNNDIAHFLDLIVSELSVDKFVLDTKGKNGQSGGTGAAFDWSALESLSNRLSMPNFFIAGGLNEDNALDARNVLTNGFDFNSGVESSPGRKSAQKIDNVLTHFIGRYEAKE